VRALGRSGAGCGWGGDLRPLAVGGGKKREITKCFVDMSS